jgi:HrpA-like RNA helicase
MDPPDEKHIQTSLDLLKDLSCIDTNHDITRQGQLFAKLGIDPRYSAFLYDTYLEHGPILELAATIVAISVAPGSIISITGETTEEKENGRDRIANNAKKFDSDLFYFVSIYKNWHSAGKINPDTRTCLTCRKSYNKGYSCGPCRAAYSRTHLLNNKTLNYIESMSDELILTMKDPCWQLDPSSVSSVNESAIIGTNLFKYFPERYGRLIIPRLHKEDACMIKSGLRARINDMSTFFGQKLENSYFIATSMAKLPNGTYVIDKLHPVCPPSHTDEDEKVSDS